MLRLSLILAAVATTAGYTATKKEAEAVRLQAEDTVQEEKNRFSVAQGGYALKGRNDGKYCSDTPKGIVCDRAEVHGWEIFKIVKLQGGEYAIKGGRANKYCVDKGDKGIVCDRDSVGAWEKFTFKRIGLRNVKWAIKGKNKNKYCADEGDKVVCNRDSVGDWEKFTFEGQDSDHSDCEGIGCEPKREASCLKCGDHSAGFMGQGGQDGRECSCRSGKQQARDQGKGRHTGDRNGAGNGCGPASMKLVTTIANGLMLKDEEQCCYGHDQCYDSFEANKQKCDDEMKECFCGIDGTLSKKCGDGYFNDVMLQEHKYSNSAFDGGQNNAIECVGATGCFSPPPPPEWVKLGQGDMTSTTDWLGKPADDYTWLLQTGCAATCAKRGHIYAIEGSDGNCKCGNDGAEMSSSENSDLTVYAKTTVWPVSGHGDLSHTTGWLGKRPAEACVALCEKKGKEHAVVASDKNCKCSSQTSVPVAGWKVTTSVFTSDNPDWTVYTRPENPEKF